MKYKEGFIAFLIAIAIVAFLAYGFIRLLTPRNLANEDPKTAFESFICSPPPQSVRDIKASGIVAFAGGHAVINFHLEPSDLDDLIHRGKFRLADSTTAAWIREYQPEGAIGNLTRYEQINEGTSQTALIVTEDRRRAWFHEIQF